MKLRNKKTGEIAKLFGYVKANDRMFFRFEGDKGTYKKEYNSLAELNECWEDYQDPKHWFISEFGHVYCVENVRMDRKRIGWLKEIGNWFDSEEDAEKAVEKLKAWKRLKDNGISFETKVIDGRWYLGPKVESQPRTFDEVNDLFKDVMFVFGGEE